VFFLNLSSEIFLINKIAQSQVNHHFGINLLARSIFTKLNELPVQVDGVIYKPISIQKLLREMQTILATGSSKKCYCDSDK
jgi:hypothetical protein